MIQFIQSVFRIIGNHPSALLLEFRLHNFFQFFRNPLFQNASLVITRSHPPRFLSLTTRRMIYSRVFCLFRATVFCLFSVFIWVRDRLGTSRFPEIKQESLSDLYFSVTETRDISDGDYLCTMLKPWKTWLEKKTGKEIELCTTMSIETTEGNHEEIVCIRFSTICSFFQKLRQSYRKDFDLACQEGDRSSLELVDMAGLIACSLLASLLKEVESPLLFSENGALMFQCIDAFKEFQKRNLLFISANVYVNCSIQCKKESCIRKQLYTETIMKEWMWAKDFSECHILLKFTTAFWQVVCACADKEKSTIKNTVLHLSKIVKDLPTFNMQETFVGEFFEKIQKVLSDEDLFDVYISMVQELNNLFPKHHSMLSSIGRKAYIYHLPFADLPHLQKKVYIELAQLLKLDLTKHKSIGKEHVKNALISLEKNQEKRCEEHIQRLFQEANHTVAVWSLTAENMGELAHHFLCNVDQKGDEIHLPSWAQECPMSLLLEVLDRMSRHLSPKLPFIPKMRELISWRYQYESDSLSATKESSSE